MNISSLMDVLETHQDLLYYHDYFSFSNGVVGGLGRTHYMIGAFLANMFLFISIGHELS